MQSHLPYVTDYANAARRFGTVDIMVRPVVADIPILVRSHAEIGARVTRRAFARFERGNSQTRTSYRRWTTARAWRPAAGGGGGRRTRRGAALPSAETLAGARGAGADARARPTACKRERARIGNPGWISFSAGGDSTVVAAWTKTRGKGRTIVPAPARAGVGTIATRIPTTAAAAAGRSGVRGGASRGSVGARRREVRSRVRQPGSPAPSMTRRRAYGSHSQDRLDEFHRVRDTIARPPSPRGGVDTGISYRCFARAHRHRSTALERRTDR